MVKSSDWNQTVGPAALGGLSAVINMALCLAVAAVLSQQFLVSGNSVAWGLPALATVLGVLGSAGPGGFYNELPSGALGLGVDALAIPWVFVAAAPVVVVAHVKRRVIGRSLLTVIAFGLCYGIVIGLGVGFGSMWAMSTESNLVLPVSPDLVAGRSALLAIVVASVVRVMRRLGPFSAFVQPVIWGAICLALTTITAWLAGVAASLFFVSPGMAEVVVTSAAITGGNMTTTTLLQALGVEGSLTIHSGITGAVEQVDIAAADPTGTPVVLIASVFTAVLLAFTIREVLRGSRMPKIYVILGITLGFAGAGAGLAEMLSGGMDLVILPLEPENRSLTEVRLDISGRQTFTTLGSRSLFVGFVVLLFERLRVALTQGNLRGDE